MLHGDRIVTQRDLYWEAKDRRRRRAEREESTHILRGLFLVCFLGAVLYGILLAI